MRVAAEFVAARQEWNPDTGEQTNFLVLGFAGREYVFEVSAEELVAAIKASAASRGEEPAERHFGGDEQLEEPYEPEAYSPDDGVRHPPPMFQTSGVVATDISTDEMPRPAEPLPTAARLANIKANQVENPAKKKLLDMRQRAKAVPMRTVAKDEMGYPIVPQRQAPDEQQVVIRAQTASSLAELDEDGFGQA